MNKPVIRTIHHLSCTGGTLISKCLAAMDNIALISEVHPYNIGNIHFNPLDPIQVLLASNMVTFDCKTLDTVFLSRIHQAEQIATAQQKKLVIRDHSHYDYLIGEEPKPGKASVNTALKKAYTTKSVVTVRDPKNAYASLLDNNWNNANLNFDQYCQRWLMFLETYKGIDLYRYEDFCENPDTVLKKICETLEIAYSPQYRNRFHNIILTGDSGRGSTMKAILPLKERPKPETMIAQIKKSSNYKKLKEILNY